MSRGVLGIIRAWMARIAVSHLELLRQSLNLCSRPGRISRDRGWSRRQLGQNVRGSCVNESSKVRDMMANI